MKDKHVKPQQASIEVIEHEVRESKPIQWTNEMILLDRIETQAYMIELLKDKVKWLEENKKNE